MQLTAEQKAIVESTGDIRINAVAGSGKTTTIIEYARARPGSRILYLAFNKAVKLEAARKFEALKLSHVTVETAHSLAYKHVVFRHQYKVRAQGFKTPEIVSFLGLKGSGERHAEYILANHINRFVAYFCNSDKLRVQDLNYLDIVTDKQAAKFVKSYYEQIELHTRRLLAKMDKGEIEVIHDFYLKKFQLMAPRLSYDVILFDEGQDASAAMLDVFFKQPATKVIVGDTHQQIYGWRFAVNSLEKASFKTYQLSTSFRFGQDIADLAMRVLAYKELIDLDVDVSIKGKGDTKAVKSKAVVARSNLGLLLMAIGLVREGKLKRIYFEGNINSYMYADEGTSLYDVLNLYNDNRSLIRDNLISGMKDMKDLEDYIGKTEDMQLSMMVDVVKEYGDEIPAMLKQLRDKHVGDGDKGKADMVFSTVHRCKGIEYDEVQLADDFITELRLKKLKEEKDKKEVNQARLNEEINLLYVAVTRAKKVLYMPGNLMPEGVKFTSSVKPLPLNKMPKSAGGSAIPKGKLHAGKGTATAGVKRSFQHDRAQDDARGTYRAWSNDLDDELTIMYGDGVDLGELAEHFGRTKGAVQMRIRKLGLE
jgi:superfamily I DNA/RNA helicase